MFEGEPWKNPFLNENYEKVSQIFIIIIQIQGLKVYYSKNATANLLDIEVVFVKNKNISGRLLVEGNQLIYSLCTSIKDMLDIFPKLKDLNSIQVYNLKKKEGNTWKLLVMDKLIKDSIKQKDVIYFDLWFNDVWVDITMTLKYNNDESKINKIAFELKTGLESKINDLETTLINIGITSWSWIKEQEEDDYYLLSEFKIISEKGQIDKIFKENEEKKKFQMQQENLQEKIQDHNSI